jgi:hypothetical protein
MTYSGNNTSGNNKTTPLQIMAYIFMILIIVAGLYRTYDYNRKKPWEFRTTAFYLDTYIEIIAAVPADV